MKVSIFVLNSSELADGLTTHNIALRLELP